MATLKATRKRLAPPSPSPDVSDEERRRHVERDLMGDCFDVRQVLYLEGRELADWQEARRARIAELLRVR